MYLDECIDSEALMSLTELMLNKELIPQIGYRAKLLKGINELKTKSSINTVSIYFVIVNLIWTNLCLHV